MFIKNKILLVSSVCLFSTALFSDYISLTSPSNDRVWTLFGVSGFKTTGAGSGASAGAFSIFDSLANTTIDNTPDDLAQDGFYENNQSLAKVKVLDPFAHVEVRIDTTGIVYDAEDTIQTIYISLKNGDSPAFSLTYPSSFEGKRIEYSVYNNGSFVQYATINSKHTFNNPLVGKTVDGVPGVDGSQLNKVADMVDYNLSNNPYLSVYYEKSLNYDRDITKNQDLRLYEYNAQNKTWLLYDSSQADSSNDFTKLTKGKAYWGKIDTDGVFGNAGVVVGEDPLSTSDYQNAGITQGWNLISFDGSYPDIKAASTGLVVDVAAGGVFKIADSLGVYSIDVTTAGDDQNISKTINSTLQDAHDSGEIPAALFIKAFTTGVAHQFVFVSNSRFILKDTSDDILASAKTLTNDKPLNPLTSVQFNTAVTDVDTNGVESIYGEYSLVVEPLVGAGTAQDLGEAKIHIKSYNETGAGTDKKFDIKSTVVDTATDIDSATDMSAYPLDMSFDNTNKYILISSKDIFFVRDYTFTRVFSYRDTDLDGVLSVLNVNGNGDNIDILATDNTANSVATKISAISNVGAGVDGNNHIVVVTSAENSSEFNIVEDTATDHIEDNVSDDDLAKGGIKGIFSLNYLARRNVENIVAIDVDALNDDADDILEFSFNGAGVNSDFNITGTNNVYDQDNSSSVKSYLDKVLSVMSKQIAAEHINARVDCDYKNSGNARADLDNTTIFISGHNISSVDFVATENTSGPDDDIVNISSTQVADNQLEALSPNLSMDLKLNGVYTPNYVMDGPLYKMRDAGYEARAMVTGSRNLDTGVMAWDSIDLTRKPSDWFTSQEYNLFNVNKAAGYWVYLENDTGTNNLSIVKKTLSLLYTHHFNNLTKTTYNNFSGALSVEIGGLDDYDDKRSARVSAYLSGADIELVRGGGGSSIFAGKISSYELNQLSQDVNYKIFLNISDGLGYNKMGVDSGLSIDYQKPAKPVIDLKNGTSVSFSSSSSDAKTYYVYNDKVPEQSTDSVSNFIAYVDKANADDYSLCVNETKLAYGSAPYDISVFVVDGDGILNNANASDIAVAKYVPMLKSSVLLVDEDNNETNSTYIGTSYDMACRESSVQPTAGYGMWLTSRTNGEVVKEAFEPKNANTGAPLTVYVKNSDVNASITYQSDYVGERVYIDMRDKVYEFKLPTDNQITAGYGDIDTNAVDLDTDANLQIQQDL